MGTGTELDFHFIVYNNHITTNMFVGTFILNHMNKNKSMNRLFQRAYERKFHDFNHFNGVTRKNCEKAASKLSAKSFRLC